MMKVNANLLIENPPSSFAICGAFTVEFWVEGFTNSPLFYLVDENEDTWLYVELFATSNYTEFTVETKNESFTIRSQSLFFPMQWTRVCLSFDSNTSKLIQIENRQICLTSKPANLN